MDLAITLITFGSLLLISLGVDSVGHLTRLPRITLLVLLGAAIGPWALDLLPIDIALWYPIIAKLALTMVAFLLGGDLSVERLREHGLPIIAVSFSVTLMTAVTIAAGLILIGVTWSVAVVLAAIGLATAPAATHDVVRENRAAGPFTATLLGVVAIDDAWALILFSIALGIAAAVNGGGIGEIVLGGFWEVFGAIGLGLLIGLPAAYLSGRISPGRPILTEALGVVLLITGLSLWLEVSFLLAGMVTGAIVVNLAPHHSRTFREIEHVEWPFMVIFFVLAGASVNLSIATGLGIAGAAFIIFRIIGRVAGGWLGGTFSGMPQEHSRLIGLALTPQAGVALGMALVAAAAVPQYADRVLAITVGTTVFFEIFGPLLTQGCLQQVGEAGQAKQDPVEQTTQ